MRVNCLKKKSSMVKIDYTQLRPEEVLALATGYTESNLWVDWTMQQARDQHLSECVACAAARPELITTHAPLYASADPNGYACMLALTHLAEPENCNTLSENFPPIDNLTKTGPFTPVKGVGTCTCWV
uniref:Uncharacterized protein n=1 Tax=Electrophorus electricus TaxID=8005 RepID=A0AAY5E916_ELEEL